jgi:hypothetical protein
MQWALFISTSNSARSPEFTASATTYGSTGLATPGGASPHTLTSAKKRRSRCSRYLGRRCGSTQQEQQHERAAISGQLHNEMPSTPTCSINGGLGVCADCVGM